LDGILAKFSTNPGQSSSNRSTKKAERMARLTILQASQQGFGSTLTVYFYIKDGSLPINEEGDAKLLEVDYLIMLLGEPAGGATKRCLGGPDRYL
jgi:hypothetical protein